MVAIPEMSKAVLLEWLKNLLGESSEEEATERTARTFDPSKDLIEKDHTLIDMLNSPGHEDVCYCICDPDKDDCPIIFSSDGFCSFTGYSHEEIEGRNCRFLQGAETKREDVDIIRNAIKEEKEANVNLLNYKKDGSQFINQFFLAPLHSREDKNKVAYYIGVQKKVDSRASGQMPKNQGWVYTQGNHV